ncbi:MULTISPECIES: helix-turn-helix domain-containing protein [Listeria]|uniref:Phage repressor protein n=1 Tax=Listeria cornellensis FSL F6-0969 TaxID=1265820 RepID=W7BY32_9LIST|nr:MULTISPECIES: helix-turn-helix domain-containing protein [Listeria]EUJ29645.1 phage repressor protein [Listeria cornellensis FSL F6-0969]
MNFYIELLFNMAYNNFKGGVTMKATNTSQRLKEIMRERGLKQVDILRKSLPYQNELDIKMSKSTLSQYVTGVQSPDQDRIFLLSKTLGVSEPWLMGYDVPRERIPDEERNDSPNKTYSTSTREIANYIEENPDFAESIRQLIQSIENQKSDK